MTKGLKSKCSKVSDRTKKEWKMSKVLLSDIENFKNTIFLTFKYDLRNNYLGAVHKLRKAERGGRGVEEILTIPYEGEGGCLRYTLRKAPFSYNFTLF